MRRLGVLAAVSLLVALSAPAQTLPELFHKAKAQVKGESWADALKTLATLEGEAEKPGDERVRQQLGGPLVFYRGVCEANLGQAEKAQADFAKFLELEPNATMDPSMYSKKAVAAFDGARKGATPAANPTAVPAMFAAFQEFKMPANSGEHVNENWADGPIRWIMTAEEKRAWSLLTPGAEWQEFVDRFWEARNPQPRHPDNSYRTGFDRRVAFADANLVQAEGARGSMTDRGMVFVLLGPPTYVGRRPIRLGEDATDPAGTSRGWTWTGEEHVFANSLNVTKAAPLDAASNWREVWHYRRELLPKGVGYQQVDADFITKKGWGINVLQRDPAILATLEAASRPPASER